MYFSRLAPQSEQTWLRLGGKLQFGSVQFILLRNVFYQQFVQSIMNAENQTHIKYRFTVNKTHPLWSKIYEISSLSHGRNTGQLWKCWCCQELQVADEEVSCSRRDTWERDWCRERKRRKQRLEVVRKSEAGSKQGKVRREGKEMRKTAVKGWRKVHIWL